MNQSQLLLLELIKKSQFGYDIDYSSFSNIDWNEVYEEAKIQRVLGIIAKEIPKEVYKSDSRWNSSYYKNIETNIRYYNAENDLKETFEKFSIPFVIIKGNAAAKYYKDSMRRTMGDIDFCVPIDKVDYASEILLSNGYILIQKNNPGERHVSYKKNGFTFELHYHYSHEDIDIENYIVDGINNRQLAQINNHTFPMMPDQLNGLILLDHLRSHLKGGLGLRQVIDWMMFVDNELNDNIWNNGIGKVICENKMEKLAIVITRMCQKYLGLSEKITWCQNASDEICDDLIYVIVMSGNFGVRNGSGYEIEAASTNLNRVGFKWFQIAGETHWTAYKKHHWLKPFCWIYQIVRYVRKGLSVNRNIRNISDDLNRSALRAKVLKELEI